jgi:RHS repeat-associated protein
VTQVTHPDNTSATNAYTGRAVLSSDEGNGNPDGNGRIQRISQSDALGRLIYVCEITGQVQQGTSNFTPASCGSSVDIAGSGFLTTYGYDGPGLNNGAPSAPLESLTSVSQGGVSRSFIYDSLGELLTATNPESGTTTYSYDKDGNLTSKTAPLENQTGSSTVTTTYAYDHLNRLTGKSYSDGATPSACFEYDQGTATNGIGRLTTEWTQASGACSSTLPSSGVLTQRTFAAYDPLGRVSTDEQCATVNNCTSSEPYTLGYSYDLAGDMTGFSNGLTGTSALSFTSVYNSAGRLSTASGGSTQLFSATAYTPAGALSSALIGVGSSPGIGFSRSYNSRLLPTSETDFVATTPGAADVQIGGAEQFSAYSEGSISFSGSEQCSGSTCDNGLFIVTIGTGQAIQITYGQNSTSANIAASLAAVISCQYDGVQATLTASTVYFVSCTAGTNVDYAINAYADGHNWSFPQYSFSISTSGAAMTPVMSSSYFGGQSGISNPTANSVTFSGTEQSGQTGQFIIFVWPGSVNGGAPVKTVVLNWGSSSTANTLASAFAASFSACSVQGTVVTASLSGLTVTLSSCSGSTYALSTEINEWSGGSNPGFAALTNGSTPAWYALDVPAATYDSGTVELTVNGTQVASTTFGASSTSASIVSGLVSNGAANSLVTLAPSATDATELTMVAKGGGDWSDYTFSTSISYDSGVFSSPSFDGSPTSGVMQGGTGVPLYNWTINSYAPNGDVLSMTDYVMGTWTYSYDDFNRLSSGTAADDGGVDGGLTLSWTYDRYGNRWTQTATGTGNASAVQPNLAFYGNNNQVSGWDYDAAGNLTNDNRNTYAYDAEGRITSLNSAPTYAYDAEGRRVAKLGSGGTVATSYLLDLSGNQVTELNATSGWKHSNVWAAGGRLLATYEGPAGTDTVGYHFHLTDWLGTQRMQTTAAGNQEEECYSYPFGDGLTCTGTDATEHHFTGKERDAESGLDYFGARYLASGLGRWMSPDPGKISLRTLANPQKWNKYNYVLNNPLAMIDPDGQQEMWIQFRAFIPQSNVGYIGKGDGRSFSKQENASSRVSITMHIETDPAKNGGNPLLGYTVGINQTHNNLTGKDTPAVVVQAPTPTASQDPTTGQVKLNVQMNVHSGDLPASMAIRSKVNIGVNEAGTEASVSGTTSESPAFEANIAPQGGPTTNIPVQGASDDAGSFMDGLTNDHQVDTGTQTIQQPPQPQEQPHQ